MNSPCPRKNRRETHGKMVVQGDAGMNFDLTEDQRKLRATVADFAQSEVAPVAEALDRDGVFPTELFKKAGELGITAIPFSEDLGGMGLGVLDMVIALEQLARADQSLAVSVMASGASG